MTIEELPVNPGADRPKPTKEEREASEKKYRDYLWDAAQQQIKEANEMTSIDHLDGEFSIKLAGQPHRKATEAEVVKLLGTLADPNWYKAGVVESDDGINYTRAYTTLAQSPDYATMVLAEPEKHGMALLRRLFPDGIANELNIVLFSTDGIHGTCVTIDDYEKETDPEEKTDGITFSYVQPRLSHIRIGQCYPVTPEDFDFLKKLRQSSWDALATIGK